MNFYYFIKSILIIIFYLFSKTKRYMNLLILIIFYKPKTILEIGVYNGLRAKQMIEAAKIYNNQIIYYGFDLFENFYKEKNILFKELSKNPLKKKDIMSFLSSVCKVFLFKGNTKKTLEKFTKKKIKIDFLFIDGGHSVRTINNDWHYVQKLLHKKSIVVFDDYYLDDKGLIKKFGCNKIIHNLNNSFKFQKLPFVDQFYNNNTPKKIKMVKVSLK